MYIGVGLCDSCLSGSCGGQGTTLGVCPLLQCLRQGLLLFTMYTGLAGLQTRRASAGVSGLHYQAWFCELSITTQTHREHTFIPNTEKRYFIQKITRFQFFKFYLCAFACFRDRVPLHGTGFSSPQAGFELRSACLGLLSSGINSECHHPQLSLSCFEIEPPFRAQISLGLTLYLTAILKLTAILLP